MKHRRDAFRHTFQGQTFEVFRHEYFREGRHVDGWAFVVLTTGEGHDGFESEHRAIKGALFVIRHQGEV